MSEPLTLYKLIILYMLEKVDFRLSNAQISGLCWIKAIPPISISSRQFQS